MVRAIHKAIIAESANNFEAPHACGIVAGKINKSMWCKRFEKRRADKRYG